MPRSGIRGSGYANYITGPTSVGPTSVGREQGTQEMDHGFQGFPPLIADAGQLHLFGQDMTTTLILRYRVKGSGGKWCRLNLETTPGFPS